MHALSQQVRERFNFCCGYCGVSEVATGGELTIDHFVPLSRGGTDDLENLVYACFRCNINKAAYYSSDPNASLLQPGRDDLEEHYQLNLTTGILEALTERGALQIQVLRLNRRPSVERRLRTLKLEHLIRDVAATSLDNRGVGTRLDQKTRMRRLLEWIREQES